MNISWYWRRLRRMSLEEIAARSLSAVRQSAWRATWLRPHAKQIAQGARISLEPIHWPAPRPSAATDVVNEAQRLLAGEWPVFSVSRTNVRPEPDWFTDPLTGTRAPSDKYCFSIPHRDESVVGNIKYVWEPSRHQATTLLATAWWITGEDRFAERVAAHLNSWWRDNAFLSGVHWTSGIEIGLRLIAWTWIRALLSDWKGCAALFDSNPLFVEQLYWHQKYLATFKSAGSSANNHLIAELAGLACSSAAFPWFPKSAKWRAQAQSTLECEVHRQTNGDGTNREQASEYHCFVLDILLAAGLAADLAGAPLSNSYWNMLARMGDALASTLDCKGEPPRFGDGDDGRCLVVDTAANSGPMSLLEALSPIVGGQSWWPKRGEPTVLGAIAAFAAYPRPQSANRIPRPAALLEDAGCALFRSGKRDDEVWLRCDHGPLGFLSIAAHGHADALSVELRLGGVEILADPGTYCYHGENEWRRYFKGTKGHNTLTVRDEDQAIYGGPFLWLSAPSVTLDQFRFNERSGDGIWEAHHDGYARLDDPVIHHRRVAFHSGARQFEIEDWISARAPQDVALRYHLGPSVEVQLDGPIARISWQDGAERNCVARIELPDLLDWRVHCGELNPPLGWYSRGFGEKEPAKVLVGRGKLGPNQCMRTRFSWAALHSINQTSALVEAELSQ